MMQGYSHPTGAAGPGIPLLFHFTWIQGEAALPEKFAYNVNTWRWLNPSGTVHVHDDDSILKLLRQDWPDLLQLYKACGNANKKDIAMFVILHRYGGVHADVDMQCVRPLEDLLATMWSLMPVEFLPDTSLAPGYIHPALCVLGAVAGHPVLVDVLRRLCGLQAPSGTKARKTNLKVSESIVAQWDASVHQQYHVCLGTRHQFFIQPAWVFGTHNLTRYTEGGIRGPLNSFGNRPYAVLVGAQGSWHSGIQRTWHGCVYFCRMHRNVLFLAGFLLVLMLLVAAVGLGASNAAALRRMRSRHRPSQRRPVP